MSPGLAPSSPWHPQYKLGCPPPQPSCPPVPPSCPPLTPADGDTAAQAEEARVQLPGEADVSGRGGPGEGRQGVSGVGRGGLPRTPKDPQVSREGAPQDPPQGLLPSPPHLVQAPDMAQLQGTGPDAAVGAHQAGDEAAGQGPGQRRPRGEGPPHLQRHAAIAGGPGRRLGTATRGGSRQGPPPHTYIPPPAAAGAHRSPRPTHPQPPLPQSAPAGRPPRRKARRPRVAKVAQHEFPPAHPT